MKVPLGSVPGAGWPGRPPRSSEALVRGLFDTSPILMGLIEIVEGDIRILSGNHATAQFFGISHQFLRGRRISELGETPDAIRDWIHHYHESARIGGRVRFEYELFRPNGVRLLSATVAPAPTPPGSSPRFAYIVEDITERRTIEEAARSLVEPPDRPAMANLVVDHITDVFFAVDRDWTFTYANHQAERTFLKRREEFIGHNVWEVFPRAVGTLFETELRRAMDEQVTVRFEEYAPTYDTWFEAHAYPNANGLSVFMGNITDRKLTEEDRDRLLTELEEALRELAEFRRDLDRAQTVAQTGSWRLDVQRNELLWSDETYRVFGLPWGTSMTYERFLNAVHPEDRELVDQAWAAALRRERPYDLEHRIVANGAVKWVRELAELEFDANGELLGGFGTVQDITERKLFEQSLRESEERARTHAEELQAVLDAAPIAIWIAHDPECRQITGNAFADQNIMRAPRGGNVSRSARPEEVSVSYEVLRDGRALRPEEMPAQVAAATGQPVTDTVLDVRFADGRTVRLLEAAVPLFDAGGRVRGAVATGADLTALAQAEEALRESEERFRQLADAMPALVWTAEPDGRLDYVNRRSSEFHDMHQEDGHWSWQSMVHPDDLDRTARAWAEAVHTGGSYQIEHRFLRANGTYGWYLCRAVSYRDEDGRIVKWYGTSIDIHELKEAEAALAEADVAKDRFVAMLAHELRNPLNTASMAMQAVKVAPERDGHLGSYYADIIERQVATMTHLVNDLLDLARIKQGKVHLNPERVALSSIVLNALETVRPLIEEKRHGLEVELPAEPLWLHADPVRLGQIVGNLLTNAAKYTEADGNITVTAAAEDRWIVLRVRDTGVGIARDMLPHVFDLFAQADASDHRARGGMGLGLALVRQLVELHGGTVEAESDGPGQGSTFTMRIPFAEGFADRR